MRIFAACVLCAAVLAGCNPQPQHEAGGASSPSPTPTGMPPLTITGHGTARQPVTVTGQRPGGRKAYRLLAKSYQSHAAQNLAQATFQQTQVTFYDKDGTTLQAQAPQARLDSRRKQVILLGGVHAKTSSGLTLVCDRLVYDNGTDLLHGEGNVRITGAQGGQQQVLTGNSFTSDIKLTRMTMR